MKGLLSFLLLSLLTPMTSLAREGKQLTPMPSEFRVGRRFFFDSGPPFDFYDVFLVKGTQTGTSIQKLSLTPAGNACTQPATVEMVATSIPKTISELLSKSNPCAIPEKSLKKELKRRKKGLVFSGAVISMQVQCGGQPRVIRADILDRDMFDPAPNTPEHTSWTMKLLSALDEAIGPNALDKPIFRMGETPSRSAPLPVDLDAAILNGTYEALFPNAPHHLADLYREATTATIPPPTVQLIGFDSYSPADFEPLKYPRLARAAGIEGNVRLKLTVDKDGKPLNVEVVSGHPMFRPYAEATAKQWNFPPSPIQKEISGTLEFKMNCPPAKK